MAAPETKAAMDRANLLIEQAEAIGEPPEDPLLLYSVLSGYAWATGVAGNVKAFRDVADRTLALAEKQGGSGPLIAGHNTMGGSLLLAGEFAEAKAHYDQTIALYDPAEHRALGARFGSDGRVMAFVWRSIALWMLGHPEAALADADRAVRDARATGDVASLMFALSLADETHMRHASLFGSCLPATSLRASAITARKLLAHMGGGLFSLILSALNRPRDITMAERGLKPACNAAEIGLRHRS
jgi:hypothetical protein